MLSILAILGLVLAPFTAPAAASGMSMSTPDVAVSDGTAMGDMDCCPPDRPVMPDCMKACPLLTLCLTKTFGSLASAGMVIDRTSVAETFLPGDDVSPDTLAQGPPSRPPQA
jgi:hypothetical protein